MKTYIIPMLAPKGSAVEVTRTQDIDTDDPDAEDKKFVPAGSVGFWL